MGDKKSAGPPSGYTSTGPGGAYQQAATATGQANRPNQTTPFAGSSWTMGPDGKWSQTTSAAPGLQGGLFNLQGQASSATQNPISNGADARKAATDAVYEQSKSRLDPQWNQQDELVKSQLVNQGLQPGTPAYDKAYQLEANARNDAYDQARRTSVTTGGEEAQRNQQMDVTSQQAPFSAMQLIQSLMGMPSFSAGPDYLSAAMGTGAYDLKNKQMSNQAWGDLMGGLFNLGGTIGSAGLTGMMPKMK